MVTLETMPPEATGGSELALDDLLSMDLDHIRPIHRSDSARVDVSKYVAQYASRMAAAMQQGRMPTSLKAPISCQIELTSRCNQKCLHCYNCSGESRGDGELSAQEWMGIAHQVVDMGIFECIISGGEPLLMGEGLFDIMDIFHDGGIQFVFITNGMLMNAGIMKRLKKYDYLWFQVSIDGVEPDAHDYIRQTKGSWLKAVRAANLVRDAGVPLVIAHAVTRHNLSTVGKMIDFAYCIGAKRIILGIFMNSGRAIRNYEQLMLSESEREEYEGVFQEKAKQYFMQGMEVMTAADSAVSFRMQVLSPTRVALLRPNGDVKIDCSLPFKIGNIRKERLGDLWARRGASAWKSQTLRNYVAAVRSEDDLLRVRPRPYVDEDLLLGGVE